MSKITLLLARAYPSGIYTYESDEPLTAIHDLLVLENWFAALLDGTQITDKASFLRVAGTALQFPAYYGSNWDAFEECINDLEWLSAFGFLIIYDRPDIFKASDPDGWTTAEAILGEAVKNWQSEGRPFYVLLRQAGSAGAGKPAL